MDLKLIIGFILGIIISETMHFILFYVITKYVDPVARSMDPASFDAAEANFDEAANRVFGNKE